MDIVRHNETDKGARGSPCEKKVVLSIGSNELIKRHRIKYSNSKKTSAFLTVAMLIADVNISGRPNDRKRETGGHHGKENAPDPPENKMELLRDPKLTGAGREAELHSPLLCLILSILQRGVRI